MSRNSVKYDTKEEGKEGVSPRKTRVARVSSRQKKYINGILKNPKASRQSLAIQAGYSPSTPTTTIERSTTFLSLKDRLERAAAKVGVTPEGNLKTLKDCMGKKQDGKTRVAAVKVCNEMLGLNMPAQLQVQHNMAIGVLVQKVRDEGLSLIELMRGQQLHVA